MVISGVVSRQIVFETLDDIAFGGNFLAQLTL